MQEQADIRMDTVLAAAWGRMGRLLPYIAIMVHGFVIPAIVVSWFVREFAPLEVFVFVRPPVYLEIWLLPDGLIFTLASVFLVIASGAVVHFALGKNIGWNNSEMVHAVNVAWRRSPALLASLLQFTLIFAVFFILMRWPKSYSLTFLVNLIGLIFLCRFIARFGLFIPVCMREKIGMFSALKRSAALTRGHRGKVFLLQLIFAATTLALCSVVFLLVQKMPVPAGQVAPQAMGGTMNTLYNVIHGPWIWCWATLGLIGWNVTSAMLYRRLRVLEIAKTRLEKR